MANPYLAIKNARSSAARGLSLLKDGKTFNFITQSMRISFLDNFEQNLDSKPLYMFYGQHLSWDTPAAISLGGDYLKDSPSQPTNSYGDDITTRANMIAAKRISNRETNIAFRKVKWKTNTIYNHYDNNVDQSVSPNNNFYVVQDDPSVVNYGAVYKCLDNNGGKTSKFKPFQFINPQVRPEVLPDGYKWKYMFSLSGSLLSQFNTNQSPEDDFVPIGSDITYRGAPGTIDRIDVNSPGRNYKPSISGSKYLNVYDTPVTPIFIEGDGDVVDSAAIEVLSTTTLNGKSGILGTFKGVGDGAEGITYAGRTNKYTILGDVKLNRWVPVKFTEDLSAIGSVTGINRDPAFGLAKINEQGTIDSPGDVKIIFGGENYVEGTKVRIVQSSTLAFATEYNSNDGISKVKIISAGQNHTRAVPVPIYNSPGPLPTSTGAPKDFKGAPVISPLQGHGSNPKSELNANAIFVNARITSVSQQGIVTKELDFPSTNDFRQVGLIQNAIKYTSASPNDLVKTSTVRATHTIVVTDNNNQLAAVKDSFINSDKLIEGSVSGAKGRIVDMFFEGVTVTIRFIQVGRTQFKQTEALLFEGINQQIRVDTVTPPDIDVYTGDVLYINNNSKITRTKDQTETVNFLIKF